MPTLFRQLIRPGDKGSDVLAVKRAIKRMKWDDYKHLKLDYLAGPVFIDDIKHIQHNHKLHVDGIYGKKTHEIVANHFDRYGVWLYRRASLRHQSFYVNPFLHASIFPGRIDMGVDYHGYGPICAIGDGRIVGNGGAGWPGGEFLLMQLHNGPMAWRHVYCAEAIIVFVRPGQIVKRGQEIARFRWDAAPGEYPGIEYGWGTATLNLTLAAAMGNTGNAGHSDSPAGLAMARFLKSVNVPLSADPGPGPMYP